jgi:hypothetical protein
MVKLHEAENQIVIDNEVYADLLVPPSRRFRRGWEARRAWWQQTPHATHQRTRPPRM